MCIVALMCLHVVYYHTILASETMHMVDAMNTHK